MSHHVILEVEDGLTPVEAEQLRQLLYDAFGEFISVRSGSPEIDSLESAIAYVMKRYPDMGVAARAKKAEEVMARKQLARKLKIAASDVRVVVPVAERTCEVLPTVFGSSIEDEAKALAEGMREAEHDKISPLAAYAEPKGPKQTQCTPCQGLGSIELTGQRCLVCGGSGWVKTKK